MRRRSILLGLLTTACAPHRDTDSGLDEPAVPDGWPNPESVGAKVDRRQANALLALGHWSAPVSGWTQDLGVYEDGLVEMMWFDNVERPDNPFARALRLRTLRVSSDRLDPLREALSSATFERAEPYYDEEGVLDGGALTIADQASHHRRIVIVNEPAKMPAEVRTTETLLGELADEVRTKGRDGFAEGPDRVVAIWSFTRGKSARRLTVHASGLLELRTTYTTDESAHEAPDYPTPYASTRVAAIDDVDALESALSSIKLERVPHGQADGGTIWFGAELEQHIPSVPSPALATVASLLEALELSVQ